MQLVKLIALHAWLSMTTILDDPYSGNVLHDINLDEVDWIIKLVLQSIFAQALNLLNSPFPGTGAKNMGELLLH